MLDKKLNNNSCSWTDDVTQGQYHSNLHYEFCWFLMLCSFENALLLDSFCLLLFYCPNTNRSSVLVLILAFPVPLTFPFSLYISTSFFPCLSLTFSSLQDVVDQSLHLPSSVLLLSSWFALLAAPSRLSLSGHLTGCCTAFPATRATGKRLSTRLMCHLL